MRRNDDRKEGLEMKPMHYALALSAAIAVAGFAFTANPAAAANSAMAECNKQWNDATASNSTNGATYQDYLKACLKKNSSTTTTTTTAASTTATAAAPAADPMAKEKKDCNAQWKALDAATQGTQKKKDFVAACMAKAGGGAAAPADTAAAPAPAKAMAAASTAPAKDKQACNAQWKALTDAGTQGTQKKKDFVATCLEKMTAGGTAAATPAAATADAAPVTAAVPAKPAATTTTMAKPATTTAAVTAAPAATTAAAPAAVAPPEPTDTVAKTPTTDAAGKPKTPGQLAMDTRIKECGVEWKKAKADGTTNGLKWPQYWSACNKRLKAAGN